VSVYDTETGALLLNERVRRRGSRTCNFRLRIPTGFSTITNGPPTAAFDGCGCGTPHARRLRTEAPPAVARTGRATKCGPPTRRHHLPRKFANGTAFIGASALEAGDTLRSAPGALSPYGHSRRGRATTRGSFDGYCIRTAKPRCKWGGEWITRLVVDWPTRIAWTHCAGTDRHGLPADSHPIRFSGG